MVKSVNLNGPIVRVLRHQHPSGDSRHNKNYKTWYGLINLELPVKLWEKYHLSDDET